MSFSFSLTVLPSCWWCSPHSPEHAETLSFPGPVYRVHHLPGICHPELLTWPLSITQISAYRLLSGGRLSPAKFKLSPPPLLSVSSFLYPSVADVSYFVLCCLPHLLINIRSLSVGTWSAWFFSGPLGPQAVTGPSKYYVANLPGRKEWIN